MGASRRTERGGAMALLAMVLAGGVAFAQVQPHETQLRAAQVRIQSKDYAAAEKILQQVLTEHPRSSVAYNLLGICQGQTGREAAARQSFEKAIQLDPRNAPAHSNLGYLLLDEKKEAEAIKEFKRAIAADPAVFTRDPASFTAFNIYGLCLMNDRKFAEARRAFERSIHINPRYVPARANLGSLLVTMKQDDAALKEFLAAAPIAPGDPFILKSIGFIYGRKGKFDLAAQYLAETHVAAPGDPAVTAALVGAEIHIGKYEDARVQMAELMQSGQLDAGVREPLALLWLDSDAPGNAADLVRDAPALGAECYKAGYQKAEDAFEKGLYPKARSILEAIRPLQTPDAAFHDLLGSVYYALDDAIKASKEFQDAVRLEPADPDHYFQLGMLFLKHRTTDPAIFVFETALKTQPKVPKLWLGLGVSYYFANRFHEAETALRKALDLDPEYDLAYVSLGDLFEQTGRGDEALKVFRKVMELRPDSYMPYYYYGKLAAKEGPGKYAEAIQMLRKAVALSPAFAEAHYELGKVLGQAGEMQEAIVELKKSIELRPDLAQPYYQLALVYRKMGDLAKSEEQFRLFAKVSKNPNPEDLIQHLDVRIGNH